ncbi:MAG: hypothetical protein WCO86_13055, partial [Planctomycetota bacterium]
MEPPRGEESEAHDEVSDLQEVWFQIDYDGATIGYESLSTMQVDLSNGDARLPSQQESMPVVRRRRETRLTLKRFGKDMSVSAHLETLETIDGVLQSWSLRRNSADGATVQRSA